LPAIGSVVQPIRKGRSSRSARIGGGRSNAAEEKPGSVLFTGSYLVNKKLPRRPFPRAKNRLQSNLTTVYNPRTVPGACALYTIIGGGSHFYAVIRRTEPPEPSSSTNSCGMLPPGGSVVSFGSKLLFADTHLLPAPAGALSAGIKTPSSIRYLRFNDPIQDATIVRRAGRIGRRRLERIRSVFRKGRLQQITTTGKEGCGTGGDTLTAKRGRNQAINHRNRRSLCRKEY
jgi:hypothetical protein